MNTCAATSSPWKDGLAKMDKAPVIDRELLNPNECDEVVDKIYELEKYWIKRSPVQYTLGLAAYMDCGLETRDYFNTTKLENNNVLLKACFNHLYDQVIFFLGDLLGTRVCLYDKAAYPGFHIYPPSSIWSGVNLAAIHKDIQFKDVFPEEKCTKQNLTTFTLSLKLPEEESPSGVNFWPNGKKEKKEFIRYQEGHIAVHNGLTTHQAVIGSCLKRPRMTLQGHGFTSKGETLLYW